MVMRDTGLELQPNGNGVSGPGRAELSPFTVPMQVAALERSAGPSAGGGVGVGGDLALRG